MPGLMLAVVIGAGAAAMAGAAGSILRVAEEGQDCHPSYEGACLQRGIDYDCEGGGGQPPFTGRVIVVGPDEYRLDRDGDGIGCER